MWMPFRGGNHSKVSKDRLASIRKLTTPHHMHTHRQIHAHMFAEARVYPAYT